MYEKPQRVQKENLEESGRDYLEKQPLEAEETDPTTPLAPLDWDDLVQRHNETMEKHDCDEESIREDFGRLMQVRSPMRYVSLLGYLGSPLNEVEEENFVC